MITLEAGRTSTWRLPRFSALKMLRRQSLSTETRTMAPARGRRAKRAQHVTWKTHSRSGQQAIPRADAPQRAAAEGAGHLASCTCKSWFTEACENLVSTERCNCKLYCGASRSGDGYIVSSG